MPDPIEERKKKLMVYDSCIHDYSVDKPVWTEISPGHFILANDKELREYRRILGQS
jgi:oligopeptide transport system ATP-binding protein